MLFELSFMFIIILGRWILPKGNISHSALSQLLLVYLSLASDILDLLTLFNEQEIYQSPSMVRLVLIVFSLCMLQFALNLTATRGRSFHAEFDQTEIEIHQSAPSSLRSALLNKPLSRSRLFLSKLIPGYTSSSTTRPLATLPTTHLRPRASTINVITPHATIFENSSIMRRNETPWTSTNLGTSSRIDARDLFNRWFSFQLIPHRLLFGVLDLLVCRLVHWIPCIHLSGIHRVRGKVVVERSRSLKVWSSSFGNARRNFSVPSSGRFSSPCRCRTDRSLPFVWLPSSSITCDRFSRISSRSKTFSFSSFKPIALPRSVWKKTNKNKNFKRKSTPLDAWVMRHPISASRCIGKSESPFSCPSPRPHPPRLIFCTNFLYKHDRITENNTDVHHMSQSKKIFGKEVEIEILIGSAICMNSFEFAPARNAATDRPKSVAPA